MNSISHGDITVINDEVVGALNMTDDEIDKVSAVDLCAVGNEITDAQIAIYFSNVSRFVIF